MKKWLILFGIALAAFLVITGIGMAYGKDQGRRLAGPFCVGKPNAGQNAGVVRSIAAVQACRSYEIRKLGLAVPHPEVGGGTGKAGADGSAGASGEKGEKGDTGATGPAGPKGDKGDTGSLEGTGYVTLCISNGGNVKAAVGKHDCDPGHDRVLAVTVSD